MTGMTSSARPHLNRRLAAFGTTIFAEMSALAVATGAIAAALLALVEPGDEVVALEPYYDSYAASIAMAGGTRVPVTLRPHTGSFRLDLDELRAAVTDRTRLLLIN